MLLPASLSNHGTGRPRLGGKAVGRARIADRGAAVQDTGHGPVPPDEFGPLIHTWLSAAWAVMAAGIVMPGYVCVAAWLSGASPGPIASAMAAMRAAEALAA